MAKTSANQTISYKPLFDNVLVAPLEPESKTASGILLPDSVKEKPQMGKVMAIGPGAADSNGKLVPMQVKAGQTVLYKKWGGTEIKVKGEDWMILEQKDILAIIE